MENAPQLWVILKDFELYSEADKRTAFCPRVPELSRLPVAFGSLGVLTRGLGLLVYNYFLPDAISLSGKTMHLKAFDLGDAQWVMDRELGGGVTLGSSHGGVNHITMDAIFASGFIVNLDLPKLN